MIFQTTWFMMQRVARFVQKIAITELEVVTFALASLNAIMFFFWWSKPLGLAVPMKVNLRCRLDKKIDHDGVSGRWGIPFRSSRLTMLLNCRWASRNSYPISPRSMPCESSKFSCITRASGFSFGGFSFFPDMP